MTDIQTNSAEGKGHCPICGEPDDADHLGKIVAEWKGRESQPNRITVEYLREIDAGTPSACWVGCAKGDPGGLAFAPIGAMLDAAAEVAEKWRDENKAAAEKARKSPSEASRSFVDQLDGAAIECNAIVHEIRILKSRLQGCAA